MLVNTCGFVESAKQDSIDTLLAAADTGAKVVATGCMAERYGRELADSLPEASAVLGFDHYPDMAARSMRSPPARPSSRMCRSDRRTLLPLTPVDRRGQRGAGPRSHSSLIVDSATPAHLRAVLRQRLVRGPVASLKLASGCDRRCSFCAIPSFRGAFVSRTPEELLAEAEWLAADGVRETRARQREFDVLRQGSRRSAPAGKAVATARPRRRDRPRPGRRTCSRPRPGRVSSRRSPARRASHPISICRSSTRPSRCCAGCAASGRPSGSGSCSTAARKIAPDAGARSNFIVGFPGETEADYAELERFLTDAGLDAIGVFDYCDEDGTEAAGLSGKINDDDDQDAGTTS